ncbi:MAG: sensor domain-containing diguanylate cyclase [Gallionella sp.]
MSTRQLPDFDTWQNFLSVVEQAYGEADQDRYILERSLAIASEEMQALYQREKLAYEARLSTLKESEEIYKAVADHGHTLIWMAGLDKGCYYFNQPWLDFTGRTQQQEFGNGWVEGVHPDDLMQWLDAYASIFDQHEKFSLTYRLRRHDGEYRWIVAEGTPRYDSAGIFLGYVGHCFDITERRQTEEQIRNLAFYDTLTQLPNRRMLSDRLGQAMAASKRSAQYGAMMFLDLDNFKQLNDEHGHGVGDLLLIEASKRLKNCVREMDTVARFGGDEFVVILSELNVDKAKSIIQATIVARKIRTALSEPYLLKVIHDGKADDTLEHRCTISVGAALFGKFESNQDDIMRWADTAMYQAKKSGHNLIQFYDF